MIADDMMLELFALERGQGVFKCGHAFQALDEIICQPFEFIQLRTAEVAGHLYLAGMQQIDAKVGCLQEGGQACRVFSQAPQNNGRVQGNRAKGIRGKPFELSVRAAGRDDAHACGEFAQGGAQVSVVVPRAGVLGLRRRDPRGDRLYCRVHMFSVMLIKGIIPGFSQAQFN